VLVIKDDAKGVGDKFCSFSAGGLSLLQISRGQSPERNTGPDHFCRC
jgi:hypothetical protein